MMQVQLTKTLSNDTRLCIGTITRRQADSAGIRARGGDIGYFLYQTTVDDDDEVVLLARFISDEAALQIAELFDQLM